ncbi:unnamed protein product [Ectocarpus sp. 12 AP-2014]
MSRSEWTPFGRTQRHHPERQRQQENKYSQKSQSHPAHDSELARHDPEQQCMHILKARTAEGRDGEDSPPVWGPCGSIKEIPKDAGTLAPSQHMRHKSKRPTSSKRQIPS